MRIGFALQQPTGMWTNGFWYNYAKRLTNVTSPAGSLSYLFLVLRITHHAPQHQLHPEQLLHCRKFDLFKGPPRDSPTAKRWRAGCNGCRWPAPPRPRPLPIHRDSF